MNKPSLLPKGLLGHVVDLYRIARFDFTNPHSYSKFRQINALRKKTGSNVLVETGTYLGVTTRRCSRVFDRVYTIELDPGLAAQAQRYLKSKRNVEVIVGDALVEIGAVMEKVEGDRAIVFLDGHYSGEGTAKGELTEPAVEELSVLELYMDRIGGVIIDDFREFGSEGWPKKSAVISAAEDIFVANGYNIAVHLDQLLIWRDK